MNKTTDSSSGLTYNDILKAVEALKNAPVNPNPVLYAPSLDVAIQFREMYPGTEIYLNGELYD